VRILGVAATLAALVALVAVYVVYFLEASPATVSTAVMNSDGSANLTLQVVGAYGKHPFPDWVSYLVKDTSGEWRHTTIWKLPAHTLVHVTVYQFDSQTGLRNNFLAQVRGTVGGTATYTDTGNTGKGSGLPVYNNTALSVLPPAEPAHTFTVPGIDLSVPLVGISNATENVCGVAPCSMKYAHTTIAFSFRTPGAGSYRWQCFVPCAFAFLYGFGGPMQTVGYMDGLLDVT